MMVDYDDETEAESETMAIGGTKFPVKKCCVLHPKLTNHSVSECREFLFRKTAAAEKRDILKLHTLCFLCFENHALDMCKSAYYACKEPGCKNPKGHAHPCCMSRKLSGQLSGGSCQTTSISK